MFYIILDVLNFIGQTVTDILAYSKISHIVCIITFMFLPTIYNCITIKKIRLSKTRQINYQDVYIR